MTVTPHPIPTITSFTDIFVVAQSLTPFSELATLAVGFIIFSWSYGYGLPIAFVTAAFVSTLTAAFLWLIGAASITLVEVGLALTALGLFVAWLSK